MVPGDRPVNPRYALKGLTGVMSKQFKGTVTEVTMRRKHDHLFEKTLKVGAYLNDANALCYSTITLRVPRPSDVSHPGTIQLCLHNGASRVFASLTPEDVTALQDFLALHWDHARRSYEAAGVLALNLRAADIRNQEYLKSIDPEGHPHHENVIT